MKPYTLLSCSESKMIHPTKLYGRFELGQFATGQAVTVANTLRRALLSQLPGVAITLVHIANVSHEYESIPGVQEPVLDIISNLKKIVFTSEFEVFQPQIGFVHLKGPAVIRAGDLKLPFFISCVNPEQYITTLTEHGNFRLTVLINSGKQFLNHTPDSQGFIDRVAILKQQQQSIKTPYFGKQQQRFYLNWRQQRNMSNDERLTHIARFIQSKLAKKLWKQEKNHQQTIQQTSHQVPKNKNAGFSIKKQPKKSSKSFQNMVGDSSTKRNWAPYWQYFETRRRVNSYRLFEEAMRQTIYPSDDLTKKQRNRIVHNIQHRYFNTTGYLPVNAFFSPVTKVNYTIQIEEKRMGEMACFEIWTNGSIDPRRAIHRSVTALIKLFLPFQLVQHENKQLRPVHPAIQQRTNTRIREVIFQNAIQQSHVNNLISETINKHPISKKSNAWLKNITNKNVFKPHRNSPKNRFPNQWSNFQRRQKSKYAYIQPVEFLSPCNQLDQKRQIFRSFRMLFPLFNIVDRFSAFYGLTAYDCNKLGHLNILNLELPIAIYKFLWKHKIHTIEDLFCVHYQMINTYIPANKKLAFYRAFQKAFAKLFYQWTGVTQSEAKFFTKQRREKQAQQFKLMAEKRKNESKVKKSLAKRQTRPTTRRTLKKPIQPKKKDS